MLVAHVQIAAGGRILRNSWRLQQDLVERRIVALRRRFDGLRAEARRVGPDLRTQVGAGSVERLELLRQHGIRTQVSTCSRRWRSPRWALPGSGSGLGNGDNRLRARCRRGCRSHGRHRRWPRSRCWDPRHDNTSWLDSRYRAIDRLARSRTWRLLLGCGDVDLWQRRLSAGHDRCRLFLGGCRGGGRGQRQRRWRRRGLGLRSRGNHGHRRSCRLLKRRRCNRCPVGRGRLGHGSYALLTGSRCRGWRCRRGRHAGRWRTNTARDGGRRWSLADGR